MASSSSIVPVETSADSNDVVISNIGNCNNQVVDCNTNNNSSSIIDNDDDIIFETPKKNISTTTTTAAINKRNNNDNNHRNQIQQELHTPTSAIKSSLSSSLLRTPTTTTTTTTTMTKDTYERLLYFEQQGLVRKMNVTTSSLASNRPQMSVSVTECTRTTARKVMITPSPVVVGAATSLQNNIKKHNVNDIYPHRKVIYFIRHGESLGQCATTFNRRNDPSLIDCGLSKLGQQQAKALQKYTFQFNDNDDDHDHDCKNTTDNENNTGSSKSNNIELILCSPLTRAIQTAIIAFGDTLIHGRVGASLSKIMIHYHLREMGSNIPENQIRSIHHIRKDMIQQGFVRDKEEWDTILDTTTLEIPPTLVCSTPTRYGYNTASPSPMKYNNPNSNKWFHHRSTSSAKTNGDINDDDNCNDRIDTINTGAYTTPIKNVSTNNIRNYSHNKSKANNPTTTRDIVPNVLRRDYIQYMLYWLASCRTETNIVIVCHYHVIRTALELSSLLAQQQQQVVKGNGTTTPKSVRKGNKNKQHDIRPINAQPIKCYLCTRTGQLTLA